MIREEQSVVIKRPVDEVFAFVADQTNAPRWQQGLLEIRRTTSGPPGLGSRHISVSKFMGRRVEASNEYVEFELNWRVRFTGTTGAGGFTASYLTEPADGGTRLTSTIEMGPGNFIDLAEAQVSATLRREMEANLDELRELLENRAGIH